MFLEQILDRADTFPNQAALSFTDFRDRQERKKTFSQSEFIRRAMAVSQCVAEKSGPGERALLLLQPSAEYVIAFFACLLAGVVPVPAYPPRNNRHMDRLSAIVTDAEASLLLIDEPTAGRLLMLADPRLSRLPTVNLSTDEPVPDATVEAKIQSRSPYAFLQYTSGSTANPKGVAITHRNLDVNLQALANLCEVGELPHVFVSWLPPYHDMGLIAGILLPLTYGIPVHMISPYSFLQNPARWLRLISAEKATFGISPNFGYDLCVDKVDLDAEPCLDLRSWRCALSGAERVQLETLNNFSRKFESCGFDRKSFMPCYGLAEATLLVTGSARKHGFSVAEIDRRLNPAVGGGEKIVSCGRTHLSDRVHVVDESGGACPDGVIGEIIVSGPSVSHGYWRAGSTVPLTQNFGKLGPALPTGDLGFRLDQELFVTGRKKEMLIIRGQNFFPQDIEQAAAASHRSVIQNGVAAFSVPDRDETLVVIAEIETGSGVAPAEIEESIRIAIAETFDIACKAIHFVRKGQLPRTSSGKIQRLLCRDLLTAGGLRAPSARGSAKPREAGSSTAPEQQICSDILSAWRKIFPDAPLAVDSNFFALGGDSIKAVELELAATELGLDITQEQIYSHPTPEKLARIAAYSKTVQTTGRHLQKAPVLKTYLASPVQRRYWTDYALSSSRRSWSNIRHTMRISRKEVSRLQQAVTHLCCKHDSLRTSFDLDEQGKLRAHVLDSVKADIVLYEVSPGRKDQILASVLCTEVNRLFDLSRAPLFRVIAIYADDDEIFVVLTIHHMIADAWSLRKLERELRSLLAQPDIPANAPQGVRFTYQDYAHWLNQYRETEFWRRDFNFWTTALSGNLPRRTILGHESNRTDADWRGDSCQLLIAPDTSSVLSKQLQKRSISLFAFFLACKYLAAAALSGQYDLIVGTPAIGRDRPEFQDVIGIFINQVPIRCRIEPSAMCWRFVAAVQNDLRAALQHQLFQTDEIMEAFKLDRDPHAFPFTTVFMSSLEFDGPGPGLSFSDGICFTRLDQDVRFDLMTYVMKYEDMLYLDCKFRSVLFERPFITDLMRRMSAAMICILASSEGLSIRDLLENLTQKGVLANV